MTTARARIRAFSLPLRTPLRTAAGSISTRDGFLLELELDGTAGVGEATPLAGWTESVPTCRDALRRAADRFEGGDEAGAFAAVREAPAARHALFGALADLRATDEGVPLFRHLGGDPVERVPVNATIGDGPAAETVAAALDAVAEGYDCLKCKVGARPVSEDAERIRAVREAVGPAVELRADANAAWSREEARTALDALADAGVAYVEQPLAADDIAGHAALREGNAGIALDETLAARSVADALAADAADVVVLKPMALGGLDRALEAAREARRAGVEPVVTTTVDGVVARTGAVHLAAAIPDRPACGLATGDLLAGDLGPDPAPVADGYARVPRESGLGVTVDAESEHVSTGDANGGPNA